MQKHDEVLYKQLEDIRIKYEIVCQEAYEASIEYEKAINEYQISRKKLEKIDKIYKGKKPPIDDETKKSVYKKFSEIKKARKKADDAIRRADEIGDKYRTVLKKVGKIIENDEKNSENDNIEL